MSGTKPCLLFSGEIFDTSNEYKRMKNLLIGNVLHLVCSVS